MPVEAPTASHSAVVIERRLRKLEAETASRRRRTFVFGEVKPGEAKMQELLAAGVAHKTICLFSRVCRKATRALTQYGMVTVRDNAGERRPLAASRARWGVRWGR